MLVAAMFPGLRADFIDGVWAQLEAGQIDLVVFVVEVLQAVRAFLLVQSGFAFGVFVVDMLRRAALFRWVHVIRVVVAAVV